MITLHYYPSTASMAPHILLEELGVPFQLALVDRERNAHKTSEFLKLNPTGRIPVLIDGEQVLFETSAICLHLVDRFAVPALAPAFGTRERSEFYKWLAYLSNTLQPELNTCFYPERLTEDATATAQVKTHAERRVAEMIDVLDAHLANTSGPYMMGAQYTALDPYLLMLCRWTRRMPRPARTLPHLGRALEAVFARPAVQRAFRTEGIEPPYY